MLENLKEKAKTYGKYAAAVLVVFGIGAAVGRFAGPTKIEEKEKIVYKDSTTEKKDEKKDTTKKNDKVYIKLETIHPDGTRTIETRIVDKGTIQIDASGTTVKTEETSTVTEKEKTATYAKQDWMVSALVSKNFNTLTDPPAFGASVQRRIIGPFYLGAFGLFGVTEKTVGASVGFGF